MPTRRQWLIASSAVIGGVAFGVYALRREPSNPLLEGLTEGQASFNPWVRIDSQGVTLIAPHTDLGQGARSMQAVLIAEELDLEWGQFRVEPGVPSAAYFNAALAEDAVPFLASDASMLAEAMRGGVGAIFKLMGLQITGGSSSVPDSFVRLRQAGAVARETLKAAAAQQSGVPVDKLRTAQGAVVLPDGQRLTYASLAASAARLKPVQNVPLREPAQWRLIGKPMQRLDVVDKSTGALRYGIDLHVDGMLHAALKLCPRKGAPLLRHDAQRALAMRGVKAVVAVSGGVAVLADNTWRAFRALEGVDCEWGPTGHPAKQDQHWQSLEASFNADHLDKTWRDDGAVEATLAAPATPDDRNVQAVYRAPYLAHAPLEPLSAIVKVDAQRVDIWAGSQVPRFAQQQVAAITGHRAEQVHLHNQYSGGSFGHRLEFEFITLAAEVAQQRRGVPIKLTYRREDDFTQDFMRPMGMARGAGRVKDGRVQALTLDIASASVMASQGSRIGVGSAGPDKQIPSGAWNLPYALPHCRVRAYLAPALVPVSSWRSVGASTGGFFADAFLDELIHEAGADPLLERLRLVSDPVARKVLQAVGDMSGWKGPRPGESRGRGVALVESFGVPCAQVIDVRNTAEGLRIEHVWVALDVGRVIDPVNLENQVAGGVIWGLGHAMNAEITYRDGAVQQTNFHAHMGMLLPQCPTIDIKVLENAPHIRGAGEPPVPPAAPALANAIFAATGQRLREMPFGKFIRFA